MMSEQSPGYVSHRVGPVEFPVPGSWETTYGENYAVFVKPIVGVTYFQTNLIVRALPRRPGASMAWYSTAALGADTGLLHECRFVSDDLWQGEHGTGRMHVVLHRKELTQVVCQRWLLPAGANLVEVTASYGLDDAVQEEPLLRAVVSAMSIDADAPRVGDPADLPGHEPRPDADMSAATSEPVEDLTKLQSVNRWGLHGPVLTAGTIDFMIGAAERERGFGMLEIGKFRQDIDALHGLGLMDGRGRWTRLGNQVTDGFRNRRFYAQVTLSFGGARSQLDVYAGSIMATMITGPGFHGLVDGEAFDPDRRPHELMGLTTVPGAVAQWVGLSPAWTQGTEVTMNATDFYGALRAGGLPSSAGGGCPPGFEAYWDQPWVEWTVGVAEMERSVRFVNAGSAGHFAVEDLDDGMRVRLVPAPSFSVWQELVALFDAAVVHAALREGAEQS
ncbi:hypothetical protein [Zhihengliuella halotolerans]|uniref:hypothetical protein n=1 Tax=Zhihengliuella halotolerans TaxID=370736 RepID=UPI000C802F95|nr:hypothetical protein [Zhihengliuella halotolerans]